MIFHPISITNRCVSVYDLILIIYLIIYIYLYLYLGSTMIPTDATDERPIDPSWPPSRPISTAYRPLGLPTYQPGLSPLDGPDKLLNLVLIFPPITPLHPGSNINSNNTSSLSNRLFHITIIQPTSQDHR